MSKEIEIFESQIIQNNSLKYFEVADEWVEVVLHWTKKHGYQEVLSRKKKKLYVWKLTIKRSSQDVKSVKSDKPIVHQGFATKYEIQMAKKNGFPPYFCDPKNSTFVALKPKAVEKIRSAPKNRIVIKWSLRKLRSRRPFDDLKTGRAKLYWMQASGGIVRTLNGRKIGRIW